MTQLQGKNKNKIYRHKL